MEILKNADERELDALKKIEKQMTRHVRRERVGHILLASLAALAVGAFFLGHKCGHHCKHHTL